jgi:phage-related holin
MTGELRLYVSQHASLVALALLIVVDLVYALVRRLTHRATHDPPFLDLLEQKATIVILMIVAAIVDGLIVVDAPIVDTAGLFYCGVEALQIFAAAIRDGLPVPESVIKAMSGLLAGLDIEDVEKARKAAVVPSESDNGVP